MWPFRRKQHKLELLAKRLEIKQLIFLLSAIDRKLAEILRAVSKRHPAQDVLRFRITQIK